MMMESIIGNKDVVDPDVRACVSSIVSALGGSAADESGQYLLGDDALACLRDLKRWLKLYDEKLNRLDVARCLAELNLVEGDLLQILASWSEYASEDKLKFKTALSCLELLVPLTWPIEKDPLQMTENHHQHVPYLQIAQAGYKRSIINFDGARILHTAVRSALPSIAKPMKERTTRDVGIIKILLYFIRNIAMISPPPDVHWDRDDSEISRPVLIEAFNYQDIFHLLLAASSTMGEEFESEDVIILDIIFHILKGIDVDELFGDEQKNENSKIEELKRLREKEAAMLRNSKNNAPTRHNRFGSMAWIQRDNAKTSTVMSPAAIVDRARSFAKMDSSKRFKPARRPLKEEKGPLDFYTPCVLNAQAKKNVRSFVEDFLDSSFNPLFNHIRKALDHEAERVLDYHSRQFFYLTNWFLQAERIRRGHGMKEFIKQQDLTHDSVSFSLVASVLNPEMFVTLNKAMTSSFENKMWSELSATLKCFSQILLTVQEMFQSTREEDQEIAGNILSRIFYEDSTHDLVASVTRTYKDQGFGYLDSVTETALTYLRVLENYSKENVDLQVRSKKRQRRNKKLGNAGEATEGVDTAHDDNENDDRIGDDETKSASIIRERKLVFKRFSSRFVTQGCVDTFVSFTSYYNDLKPAQLKRAHRFFYRVIFKNDMSVMLFRVDIIATLHKMIKGPEGLDSHSVVYKEWHELVRQILKRCINMIRERPELAVEMLFSKTMSIAHLLQYGYEQQTSDAKPRIAAELIVKGDKEWNEQVSIVVTALLDRNEQDHLRWLKTQLSRAENEKRNWEDTSKLALSIEDDTLKRETSKSPNNKTQSPSIMIKPDTGLRKIVLLRNGLLRLLMKLLGLCETSKSDDSEVLWSIPSSLSADELLNSLNLIIFSEFSPKIFENSLKAADFITLQSKNHASPIKAPLGNQDQHSGGDDDISEPIFEPGGPTNLTRLDAPVGKKKKYPSRRDNTDGSENEQLTKEQLEARKAARKIRELENRKKIKSELFVHDSDDESNEEQDRIFFEQEEKIRRRNKIAIVKELVNAGRSKEQGPLRSLKRDSSILSEASNSNEEDDVIMVSATRKRRPKMVVIESDTE